MATRPPLSDEKLAIVDANSESARKYQQALYRSGKIRFAVAMGSTVFLMISIPVFYWRMKSGIWSNWYDENQLPPGYNPNVRGAGPPPKVDKSARPELQSMMTGGAVGQMRNTTLVPTGAALSAVPSRKSKSE